MKKNNLVLLAALISSICLFSCSKEIENYGNNTDTNAYIVFGKTEMRSVLPEISVSDFEKFVLKGTFADDAEVSLGEWTSYEELISAKIGVKPGDWKFALSAQKEGTEFTGECEKTILTGENAINFVLEISSYSEDGNGKIKISLDYKNEENIKVKAALLSFPFMEVVDGFDYSELSVSSCEKENDTVYSVCFENENVPSGNYVVDFAFEKEGLDAGSASFLVTVASSFLSSASFIWDSFDSVYSINYELNGASFAEEFVCPIKFTRNMSITLPQAENLVKPGYHFAGWFLDSEDAAYNSLLSDEENKSGAVCVLAQDTDCDRTYFAKWIPDSDTKYTVKHFKQKLDESFAEEADETEEKSGTTEKSTQALAKDYEGFTSCDFSQAEIKGDGSTEIKIFYNRNSYNLSFEFDGASYTSGDKTYSDKYEKTVLYDSEINFDSSLLSKMGYTFKEWDKTLSERMPASDCLYKALWKANTDTKYTVKHFKQTLDESFAEDADETEEKIGTTAESTQAVAKDYEGFTACEFSQGEIAPDGSTVINIKYNRKKITLTLDLQGGSFENLPENGIYDAEKGTLTFTGLYGAEFNFVTEDPSMEDGRLFAGWEPDLPETFPSENASFSAIWSGTYVNIDVMKDISISTKIDNGSYIFTADSGYDSYVWYRDSVKLSSTTNVCEVEFAGTGTYMIMVGAGKNGENRSCTIYITITK